MTARPFDHPADDVLAPQRAQTMSAAPPGERVAAWLRVAAPYLLVAAVALASRLKYAIFTYHDTLASGDAHLILTKAMLISRGQWRPPVELGGPSTIFSDPPLIALLLGGAEKATSLPMVPLAAIVTSGLTIAALCALYAVARRAFDPLTAVLGVALVALLPRFSMDSTEPDKAIYVVSFFMIALYFLYAAQTRPRLYLVAGAFIGLSAFSHTTGYIFLGVYGLSHVAITRGSERRLFDRWFIAGLIIPLVMIAAYVQLNDAFQRRAVTATPVASATADARPDGDAAAPPSQTQAVPPPASSNKHHYVPGSIQLYYDNITGLAERGFDGSAWNIYFDAIRTQTTTPMYALAVLGFVVAGALVVSRRRFELLPLMLWMMLVTLGFAIQYPALSHRTRYPTYVTPAFVLFAVFAVVTAARVVLSRTDASMRGWYVAAAIAPVVALVGASYAMSNAAGQRKLYAPHNRMAGYIDQQSLLGDNNELLYMAWPSVTIGLLEDHPADEPFLHTYGWGNAPIARYTSAYVQSQGIRYFAFDHTGSDYFQTSQRMLKQLGTQFDLKRMATFCGTDPPSQRDATTCGESYTVLYELLPKS